jgi:hypothetical protein
MEEATRYGLAALEDLNRTAESLIRDLRQTPVSKLAAVVALCLLGALISRAFPEESRGSLSAIALVAIALAALVFLLAPGDWTLLPG